MAKLLRKFREGINGMKLASEGNIASRAVMEKYLYGPSDTKATLAIWKSIVFLSDEVYECDQPKIKIGEALNKHFDAYFGKDYKITIEHYEKSDPKKDYFETKDYFEINSPKASGILIIEKMVEKKFAPSSKQEF